MLNKGDRSVIIYANEGSSLKRSNRGLFLFRKVVTMNEKRF